MRYLFGNIVQLWSQKQNMTEDKKLSRLTWATAIGVAALLAPGLVVWNQYVTVPENATQVKYSLTNGDEIQITWRR